MNLGAVVFGNHSGLGNQTRRLTQMLKPARILYIDSRGFSQNQQSKEEWYSGFSGYKVNGFPSNYQIDKFLNGLSHVIVCENPLNFFLFSRARERGIKTYCQSNFEFADNLVRQDLPLPDLFLMPSFWQLETMVNKFGSERVKYLPPPINPIEFKEVREVNLQRTGDRLKLLHVIGTLATHDRNGTLDLLQSLQYLQDDFSLTIHSQRQLPSEYMIQDSRITYSLTDLHEPQELYKDFDAVILPRRYGGLSLVMNEALMSGLPVFMPDISPNNQVLPKDWLYSAEKTGEFQARTMIDVYSSFPMEIAGRIKWLLMQDLGKLKLDAFELAYNNFSDTILGPRYEELLV